MLCIHCFCRLACFSGRHAADIEIMGLQAVQSMVHKCRLKALEAAISAELRTFRLNFKTAKKERAPRR